MSLTNTEAPGASPLLTLAELAEMLGVGESTLHRWRAQGEAPPAIKLPGGRSARLRFRMSDVEDWLTERSENRWG